MKYDFRGFHNWPARSGELTGQQAADVLRASLTLNLPRETCEGCVCWREHSTCLQVQVEHMEYKHGEAWHNCCPVLFFDFIGIPLPELKGAAA